MIDTVVFDIGRVLLEWYPDAQKVFPGEVGEKVTYAIWGSGTWEKLDLGAQPDEEIVQEMIDLAPEYKEQINYMLDHLELTVKLFDYAISWVKELKNRGFKVYYLSNYSHLLRERHPWTVAFTEYMDGGIFSADEVLVKPDHRIYKLLIDRYALKPDHCVFVDDRPENVEAAIACGMQGIVFENYEKSRPLLERMLTPVRVFCYGDSNTYGYNPLTGGRWPRGVRWTGLLQEKLGEGYEVLEQGCNSRTTIFPEPGAEWKSGLYGLEVSLYTCKPIDVMVLMLGTNDLKDFYHVSAAEIAAGVEILVQRAKVFMKEATGKDIKVILVSPIEVGENIVNLPFGDHFKEDAAPRSREFAALYKEVAERNECIYVNAAEVAVPSEADQLHMMPDSHAALAEAIYRAIV